MSRDTLEKLLYDLSTNSANRKLFTDDPAKLLGRYQISAEEAELVKAYDVRRLADLGVNTMLTWGFWLQSGRSNGQYLKAMKRQA